MSIVYLDIETVPADALPGQTMPPARWIERAPDEVKRLKADSDDVFDAKCAEWAREQWQKESLDPVGRAPAIGGRVLAVGLASGDDDVTAWTSDHEDDVLTALEQYLDEHCARYCSIVGHNIRGFDAPFLAARALRSPGKYPAILRAFMPKDRWGPGPHIVDTMQLIPVTSYGGRPTGTARLSDWVTFLDEAIAEDQIDGSHVLGRYLAGDLEAIARHLIADVREVRTLHQRLTAAKPYGRQGE
jgi:hypothetical protein